MVSPFDIHAEEKAESEKKSYRRSGFVPFKGSQTESIFQKVRRSDEPFKTADKLGVLDEKKAKKMLKELLDIFGLIGFCALCRISYMVL